MTMVKICGLRDVDHALAAALAGADFLGLIFAPGKRQVPVETACLIVKAVKNVKPEQTMVGVFVNELPGTINRIVGQCGLDILQLSGDESIESSLELEKPFIKAIHVSPDMNAAKVIQEIEKWNSQPLKNKPMFLLDTHTATAYGGTGQAFDWQIAKAVAAKYPVIVAGGLTPENVGEMVRLVKPWGVDASSGVEVDGVKSTPKIVSFIKAVRDVDDAISRFQAPRNNQQPITKF
jgi:phosphoribosylanthranilate isomerase